MPFDHNFGFTTGAPGFQGTDPLTPFPTVSFEPTAEHFLLQDPHQPHIPSGWLPPNTFEAIHGTLIPKGPFRGMVLVWDEHPVYGMPTIAQDPQRRVWSFQRWAIVDPRPNLPANTPRFHNFLLPIGPVTLQGNAAVGENIFCSGHVLTPEGDLVVVGGTKWDGGIQAGAKLTYIFDPAQDSAPFPLNGTTTPLYTSGGTPQSGMWLRGPDLASSRYYPSAVLTHIVPRTGVAGTANPPVETIGVLGGDVDFPVLPSDFNVGNTINWATWNSYETLLIKRPPQHPINGNLGSGLVPDVLSLTLRNFDGPGTLAGNQALTNPPTFSPVQTLLIPIDWLWFYPRTHLLSNGMLFVSGFTPSSRALDHDAIPSPAGAPVSQSRWLPLPSGSGIPASSAWGDMRTYGASVRAPNLFGNSDIILRIGGAPFAAVGMNPLLPTNTVEYCDTRLGLTATWTAIASMHHPRATLNAVLLPDASVAVFGGADSLTIQPSGEPVLNPVMAPEIYVAGSGWSLQPPGLSPRTYHSIALLLPDASVLVGGGDTRNWDYEIFEPAYLSAGQRPQDVFLSDASGVLPNNDLHRGQRVTVTVTFEDAGPETFIGSVVLMAPGSTTHHSDMTQRYHRLALQTAGQANKVDVDMPLTDRELPSGLYMLFAVSNTGVPSEAIWIKLLSN